MSIINDFQYVKSNVKLADYANDYLQRAKRGNKYVCPKCQSGGHSKLTSDSAFSLHGDKFKCHACDAHGDIFELAGLINNTTDKRKQLELVAEYAHIQLQDRDKSNAPANNPIHVKKPQNDTEAENETDTTERKELEQRRLDQYLKNIHNDKINTPAVAFLKQRGLTLQDALNYRIGYNPANNRICYGYKGNSYYHNDRTLNNHPVKLLKPKGLSQPIYNIQALDRDYVILVEGEIDAISLLKIGFENVVSTAGGTASINSIIRRIKERPKKPYFFMMFDNDEAGAKFTETTKQDLEAIGAIALDVRPVLTIQGKDANEIFLKDAEALKRDISDFITKSIKEHERIKKEAYRSTLKAHSVVSLDYEHERIYYQTGINEPISTGFSNLDFRLNGGFHSKQLITIGALSSMGKTSFCLCIAHNMALKKQPVLFVSVEQSALELDAKLISYYTHKLTEKGNTSRGIAYCEMLHKDTKRLTDTKKQRLIQDAIDQLTRANGDNFHVMQCQDRPTVKQIAETAKVIADNQGKAPVIFIDYLQLLAPLDPHERDNRRITDANLTELKQTANALNTPVVIISSINRNSYKSTLTFESFKESGCIEYSSDVVLGLEPQGLKNLEAKIESQDVFKKQCKERYEKSKDLTKSALELLVLKNRNGSTAHNKQTLFWFNKPFSCFDVKQTIGEDESE